jgi:hypothetical protein
VRVVTFNRSDNVLTPHMTNVFNKQNATGTSLPASRTKPLLDRLAARVESV